MHLVWLGIFGLLSGHHQLLDSVLIDQVWGRSIGRRLVIFDGLFYRDFNLILLAGVYVAVDVDERRLPWASGEEAKV